MSEEKNVFQSVWWFPSKSWNLHQVKNKPLSIEWMRGEAWIAHCLKVAAVKATSRLPDAVFNEVQINEDSFRAYKTGRDIPLARTIEQVNKALPGTRETWNVGPGGLPLWSVLAQNHAFCQTLVDDELANQGERPVWCLLSDGNKRILDRSLLSKAQALLEVSVPEHFWSRIYWNRPTDPWAAGADGEPDQLQRLMNFGRFRHEDRDASFLTLGEFIGLQPNVLAAAYAQGVAYSKAARGRIGIAKYRYITNPRRLLSLLALCVLLNKDRDAFGKEVAFYIRLGIDQALQETFGSAMHKYVVENFVE